jgi:hypothetical protein
MKGTVFMADRSSTLEQSRNSAHVFAARFVSREDTDAMRAKLETLGYEPNEISYISDPEKCSFTFDDTGSHVGRASLEGVAGGAALGAGVSVGFGALGMGSALVLGPIGLLAGVAIGGFVGVLLGAGLNSDQALACEKAVRSGSLVMTVQAHPGDDARIRELLAPNVIAAEEDF